MIKFSIPLRSLAASSAQLGSLFSSVKWPRWLSTVSVLSEEDALRKLRKTRTDACFAFYSSQLKGIIKESHLMSVPMDDFLIHRGYGVYDTAIVRNGKVYELDQHLDRFEASAKSCDLWTEDDFINRPNLRNIILDTIKAAGRRDQLVRYWLGAGRGGFGISKKHCDGPSFYVVTRQYQEHDPVVYEKGVKVITSTVPMKAKLFANVKTTNYLPNALTVVEAESKGAFMGIWVDEDGFVAESAIANVAFIKDKSLIVPTFDKVLEGLSILRIMHLARTQLNMTIVHQPVPFHKVEEYDEAFMCGGNKGPVPIIQWDHALIGEGLVGPWSRKLRGLYLEDMDHAFGDNDHLISLSDELHEC